MRNFLIILSALFLTACAGTVPLEDSVAAQLELYPESRVTDLYKSFCQDAFGPGHLINNPEAARRYLKEEIALYKSELQSGVAKIPEKKFVPCGAGENFYRADLSLILDGTVSEEKYFTAFLRSTENVNAPTMKNWKRFWNILKLTIEAKYKDIPNAAEDIAKIEASLQEGRYIIHHSDEFCKIYHPHYRIIRKEIIEELTK